jgi:hypothetical protein
MWRRRDFGGRKRLVVRRGRSLRDGVGGLSERVWARTEGARSRDMGRIWEMLAMEDEGNYGFQCIMRDKALMGAFIGGFDACMLKE